MPVPGWSPPSWWSGLKSISTGSYGKAHPSPPSWWSGLKSDWGSSTSGIKKVSTLVVEWIEIEEHDGKSATEVVSTLVVEWIEISSP